MKESLLTLGAFTEEQADTIMNDKNIIIPTDFWMAWR